MASGVDPVDSVVDAVDNQVCAGRRGGEMREREEGGDGLG